MGANEMRKMKVDLKYLKKNLDLKKFVKFLNKTLEWGNDRDIYYLFLEACSTKKISYDDLFDAINDNNLKLYEKFEDQFISGMFLPTISDNFKLEKITDIIGRKKSITNRHSPLGATLDPEEDAFWIFQIISSKINKTYYVAVYQGYDYHNDGYYINKKFKDKKFALKYVEKRKVETESAYRKDSRNRFA